MGIHFTSSSTPNTDSALAIILPVGSTYSESPVARFLSVLFRQFHKHFGSHGSAIYKALSQWLAKAIPFRAGPKSLKSWQMYQWLAKAIPFRAVAERTFERNQEIPVQLSVWSTSSCIGNCSSLNNPIKSPCVKEKQVFQTSNFTTHQRTPPEDVRAMTTMKKDTCHFLMVTTTRQSSNHPHNAP